MTASPLATSCKVHSNDLASIVKRSLDCDGRSSRLSSHGSGSRPSSRHRASSSVFGDNLPSVAITVRTCTSDQQHSDQSDSFHLHKILIQKIIHKIEQATKKLSSTWSEPAMAVSERIRASPSASPSLQHVVPHIEITEGTSSEDEGVRHHRKSDRESPPPPPTLSDDNKTQNQTARKTAVPERKPRNTDKASSRTFSRPSASGRRRKSLTSDDESIESMTSSSTTESRSRRKNEAISRSTHHAWTEVQPGRVHKSSEGSLIQKSSSPAAKSRRKQGPHSASRFSEENTPGSGNILIWIYSYLWLRFRSIRG